MNPSGTLQAAINAARSNAAKCGHPKLLPVHVAEAILQASNGKAILRKGFGEELDPNDLLNDIQDLMMEATTEIKPEEVTFDESYERLMAIALGKAMAYDCNSISTRCALAAIAAMTGPLANTFKHYELTEAALNALIVRNAKQNESRQLAAASSE
jgi:ATP-dependent Clp protease ATP-binding subunit ClpA